MWSVKQLGVRSLEFGVSSVECKQCGVSSVECKQCGVSSVELMVTNSFLII